MATIAHETRSSSASSLTRRLALVAGVLWLAVATSPTTWWQDTDDWQPLYAVYTFLLLSAAALTAAVSISVSKNHLSGAVARLGVVLTAVAVCSTLVAWALPLWMGSIAIGYGVLAIGVPEHRRGLGLVATAQLAGLVTGLTGEAIGVGTTDEWGNQPVAWAAAIITTGLLTAGSLIMLTRECSPSADILGGSADDARDDVDHGRDDDDKDVCGRNATQ